MEPNIVAVHLNPHHTFSKQPQAAIRLLAGRGVEGDAHCGETVQHLYLKRKDPTAPNRMQVHLLPLELLAQLQIQGHTVAPGQLGENITTQGVELLRLPLAAQLHLGPDAIVELTGLRTPCRQIDVFQSGLQALVTDRLAPPRQRSLAGVMAVVVRSGTVTPSDRILVALPAARVALTQL